METHFSRAHVCIVGLGLMGGSLGLALRQAEACRLVTGSDSQPDVCAQAVALGAVQQATSDAAEAVAQADIVVLAAPVRTIIRLVGELGPRIKPGALLMDIGSTKSEIVQAMDALPAHVQAIGGHPMCGKERSGIAASDAKLYRGAVFCLTPLARTRPHTLALAQDMAQAVGARPLVIDPVRHDGLVAVTSHLPYLMAAALAATAGDTAAADSLAWQLAASGFRDTSRLAGSDIDMMVDILLTNRAHVAAAAGQAAQKLAALAAAIEGGDEAALRLNLAAIRETWRQVYH
jgi:prephenate dehydrogenase